jgi:signal peptidase I
MSDIETQPEAPARGAESAAKPRRKSLVREYGEAIVVAVLLALLIRAFVVQAFTIPSGSMMDTLLVGDYILVNKFLYGPEVPFTDAHLPGLRDPQRGDIIVFKYPNDETRDFIKRIVAVGGETVQVKDNRAFVNGEPLEEDYVRPGSIPSTPSGHCGYLYGCDPVVVPSGAYFVMGDNRDNSQDSRYWGFVKREKIRGKAFLIYWSWNGDRHWLRWRRLGNWLP